MKETFCFLPQLAATYMQQPTQGCCIVDATCQGPRGTLVCIVEVLEESAMQRNREDQQESVCATCECRVQTQRDRLTSSKSLQSRCMKTLTVCATRPSPMLASSLPCLCLIPGAGSTIHMTCCCMQISGVNQPVAWQHGSLINESAAGSHGSLRLSQLQGHMAA